MEDFASWYRRLALQRPEAISGYFADLARILDGFESIKSISAADDPVSLGLHRRSPGEGRAKVTRYALDELSDGERAIVALYAVLHFALDSGAVVCLDEPDNFLELPEIEPWARALRERVETLSAQALVATHNAQMIDTVPREAFRRIERIGGGPARVVDVDFGASGGLTASQQIARGE